MQLLEGNSCEPLLQRPLACFLNYLCILSFLCFTHSPLAPLQPRLNDQLILGGFVVRMVEFPIDDIFDEIFVLFHCLSFLLKKKPSSKPWSAFFGQILILVRFGANKILVCSLIHVLWVSC